METATKRGVTHLPAGEGQKIWAVEDTYTFKTRGPDTNGAFMMFQAEVPPGGGPPPHTHQREDEAFYVLEGEVEFLDGDRLFTGTTGSYIHIPPGILHRFRNVGTSVARMLIFFTPGGFSEFFFEVGQPAVEGGTAPPLGPKEIKLTLELAPAYGMDVRLEGEPKGR